MRQSAGVFAAMILLLTIMPFVCPCAEADPFQQPADHHITELQLQHFISILKATYVAHQKYALAMEQKNKDTLEVMNLFEAYCNVLKSSLQEQKVGPDEYAYLREIIYAYIQAFRVEEELNKRLAMYQKEYDANVKNGTANEADALNLNSHKQMIERNIQSAYEIGTPATTIELLSRYKSQLHPYSAVVDRRLNCR